MMFPRQLAQYTGFTDEEVRQLCSLHGRDYDRIREWYDGYPPRRTENGQMPLKPSNIVPA